MFSKYTPLIAVIVVASVMGYITENIWIAIRFGYLDNRGMLMPGLIGYSAAFTWAIFTDVKDSLLLICSTYFFSVVLLSISNKVIHFRASGHACSFAGPLVLLVHFFLG